MQRPIAPVVPVCPSGGNQKAARHMRPLGLGPTKQDPRRHIEIARQKRPHQPSAIRAKGPAP